MGYIKEPEGIDLVVEPSILTEQEKSMISEIIANYKLTGKKPNGLNTPLKPKKVLSYMRKPKIKV